MNLFGIDIKFPWEKKASAVTRAIMAQFLNASDGVFRKCDPKKYADEAFMRNSVAYKVISILAKGAANVPLCYFQGDKELENTNPVAQLLKHPNPWQSWKKFCEVLVGYLKIDGNVYIEAVGNGPIPTELYILRPDRVRVKTSPLGIIGYIYEVNGQKKEFEANPITGESQILHIKLFSPLDDIYGMSPVEAAASAVDSHNAASLWNISLLSNSARPSGALVRVPTQGGSPYLTDPQFDRLKKEVESQYSGARNAGRPMLLEGLDWKQMSMSPLEMDWMNSKNMSAREICYVYDVPPQILGIPGDNTYANYQEARQSLYEDNVLPLLESILEQIEMWLNTDIDIRPDIDNHPAFAVKRKDRWAAVQAATFLTLNEKRAATGYDRIEEEMADEVMVPPGLVPLSQAGVPPEEEEVEPKPGEKKFFEFLKELETK